MIKSARFAFFCISKGSISSEVVSFVFESFDRCLFTSSIGVIISIDVISTSIIACSIVLSSCFLSISHESRVGLIIIIFKSGFLSYSKIALSKIILVRPVATGAFRLRCSDILAFMNSI